MFQIISIAFQLSGAIILLLWSFKFVKRNNIYERYFPGSNIAERDKDNNVVLKKEKLRTIAREVHINIFAFGNLIIGYAMTFCESEIKDICFSIFLTSVLTIVILILEYFVSHIVAKIRFKEDEIMPYDKVESYGVETTITEEELNEILK